MKKAVFVHPDFYHKFLIAFKDHIIQDHTEELKIKTIHRNTQLLPITLGTIFLVYNGKSYIKVLVSENIIGHKLGEFSISRRRYYFKKGKQKTKMKK